MALRRKMLETLSGMAKQQEERHSNRLQIIEPTQQELLSDYHMSQIPELKEKKSRKKAQDKAMEEQAYLKYMLENPKLLEDITLKKDKKKTIKANIIKEDQQKEAKEKQKKQLISIDKAMDDFFSDKELAKLAKLHPEETAEAVADAIVGIADNDFMQMMAKQAKELADKQQALDTMSRTRHKLASVDDGIDETGAEEEEAEEEEAGDIDYISQTLADNPTALTQAKALKASYSLEATNDYAKNLATMRENKDVPLNVRQAVALQLTMEASLKSGVSPVHLPEKAIKSVTSSITSAPARQATIKEALARSTTAPAPGSAGVASAVPKRVAGVSAHIGPKVKR